MANVPNENKKLNPSYMVATIIKRVDDEDSAIKAYAQLTYSNAVTVHGIRVIEGKNGLFVSMPQQQAWDSDTKAPKVDENGKAVYEDVVYTPVKEVREDLFNCVLNAYNNEEGFAYVNANKDKSRNTDIKPELRVAKGDSIKAVGKVAIGDLVCKDILVGVRDTKDGQTFATVNYPNYVTEKKDGSKVFTNYFDILDEKKGHTYDFADKGEKPYNFEALAKNVIIKEAKKINPELKEILNKNKSMDTPSSPII